MYLNCHSYFSLKYGTLSIKQLIGEAIKNHISTLVLTDINNTSAGLEFVRQCEKHNIKPILGIDFRNEVQQEFIGIARNNEGFKELNTRLTELQQTKTPVPFQAPAFKDAFVVYPLAKAGHVKLRANEFLGVTIQDLNRLKIMAPQPPLDKLVVLHPVTFRNAEDFRAHQLLRAIDKNLLLSQLTEEEQASPDECMEPTATLLRRFWDFPKLIRNTQTLLEQCQISFEFGKSKNKKHFTESRSADQQLLRKAAFEGFKYRYGEGDAVAVERLEKELKVIHDLGYSSYFLINWDIIQYANRKGYYYVGRGSGANSMVAYCLKITDVDPIDLDLYFERFINYYRSSPPDFDIDFSWKDRDDIIQYILNKYGYEHACLLGSYNTFSTKSARRELAKVFGIPKEEADKFVTRERELEDDDFITRKVFKYANLIHGFPSHLSIHAGGILISEKPLTTYTSLNLPPKGFPVTHFDMVTAEDIGLYKFDVLSQRGLGHIKDALQLIEKNHHQKVDIHQVEVFKQDQKVKDLIRNGKAIGCFYVESPGMRMLLSKLQCEDYKTLVAASSIIRPGVSKSGMMREYILRFHNPNSFTYIHPKMEELLADTFGVMVYQEDVIKVAHHFAGLTLAEADVLRRGMSGKFRSRDEFKKIADSFFANCRAKGYPEATTREVWRQIESFSGFSFSKAHSASYAVESFQSLYLKAHFPLELMVSVINNFGGFYSAENYFHEIRMNGGEVLPPCVNQSEQLTTLNQNQVRLGFIHVKSLEKNVVDYCLQSRALDGPFQSLADFIKRVPISLEQLLILIRINAFKCFNSSKKALIWEAHLQLGNAQPKTNSSRLFQTPSSGFKLPDLNNHPLEDAFDEMELLDFPLQNPFDLLNLPPTTNCLAADLPQFLGREVTIYGYLVHIKNTRTSKYDRMHFGAFTDQEGHFFDSVHFPGVATKYPFKGKGVYRLTGTVTEEFNFYTIEVRHMQKLAYLPDPRYNDPEVPTRPQKATRTFRDPLQIDQTILTQLPQPQLN